MHDNKILGLLPLVMVGIAGFIIFRSIDAILEAKRSEETFSMMTETLRFLKADTSIESSGTTLLVLFNSECRACQEEMIDIKTHMNQLKSIRIFFISHEPPDDAVHFLRSNDVLDPSGKRYLKTDPEQVIDLFKGRIPQILIYQDNNLLKHFKGYTSITNVINLI